MGAIATATDHQSGTLHNRLIRMPIRKTTKDTWISAAYRPKKIFAMGRIVSQAGQGHETPKTRAPSRGGGTIPPFPIESSRAPPQPLVVAHASPDGCSKRRGG